MTRLKVGVLTQMLRREGIQAYTGVPDSTFKVLHRHLDDAPELRYISSVSEPAAVGVAVGLHMAGCRPALVTQNSGLGFSINHLASLAIPYRIPMILLVGWRGWRGQDSPIHTVMGRATIPILESVGIPHVALEPEDGQEALVAALDEYRDTPGPFAVVMRKGVLAA